MTHQLLHGLFVDALLAAGPVVRLVKGEELGAELDLLAVQQLDALRCLFHLARGGASVPTLRSRPPPVSERRADKGDAAAPFHARTAGATAPRLEPVARDTLISASPPQFHTLHLARRWFAGHSSRRNGGCGTEVASPSQMLSPGGFAMSLCTKSMRPLILCATRSPRPSAVLLQSYLNPRPPLEFQTNTTFGLPRLSTFD